MKRLVSIGTLLVAMLNVAAAAAQSRINFNRQEIFLNGANFAWVNFARDIGPGFTNFNRFESIFQDVHANGGNAMRLWLHTNGASTPQFDSGGRVIGPGTGTIEDLRRILDLAWENRVGMLLCLWSFDMLRTSFGSTITDRSMNMLADTSYTNAYIENSLIPMVEALQGHPAIIAWEVFNEPEGMSNEHGWDFVRRVPMAYIQRFVNLCAGAIHRTDPNAQVTNGAWSFISMSDVQTTALPKSMLDAAELSDAEKRDIEQRFLAKYGEPLSAEQILDHMRRSAAQRNFNYYSDDRLISAGGDPLGILDFYTVHYYDWAGTALSPFHHPKTRWNLDKALAVAEFSIKDTFGVRAENLYRVLHSGGYAGAMAWSFTDTHLSSVENMLASMLDIKTRYPDDVTIEFPAGTILSFVADREVIGFGESTWLAWHTVAGSVVTLNGQPVASTDNIEVALAADSTFTLIAGGQVNDTSRVAIRVSDPQSINRAVLRPAVASSGEPDSDIADPALAVDGDLRTRWSSAWRDNEWIYIDLGQSHAVRRVVLHWEVAYARSYTLAVSHDAVNWTEIYRTDSGDGGIDDVQLYGFGRYVRMHGLVRATQWGFSLWEFEVYGEPSITDIAEDEAGVPDNFALAQNYPNPFNPKTTISYHLAEAAEARLVIFDVTGRQVATLVDAWQTPGNYQVIFDASGLASGAYYYRLGAGAHVEIRRMVLLR